ncbi:TetR family transcriptional regulator C-terminal domain-containing protein [Nocardia terpenica]|uniref:TetR/AcrR family transcriptional regulator n=1 Tax=Nocardia terpenica TaxID=455432 RepID=UPI001894E290|nr:TetR family transcriptional regulator C-terminal domain-containing protein [Nocardia terpenica]MBF6061251.1 TetR family transcriptional regulator C-terminal domain-containing protein [Nocardia terpenica]MBF6105520.1 TetR family transcriptional regulator C-terminal domain-containing protein [Nocardia terpenica]MBF6113010.1 TetR family transcriptional regulator C-terminal domain-containing protein [Nocardia terpenica]MBF6119140.1 TetR family transcriptional regulator C-terminal domain-containi
MPKIVDHQVRRVELAEAVGRVVARDGVDGLSVRSVAAEAGWSPGALRYYFTTRTELLAFACAEVITRVTARVEALPREGSPRDQARALLHETMPLDDRRRTEAAIAFSFVALGLGNSELAEVERRHFDAMYGMCRDLVDGLAAAHLLAETDAPVRALARRLHALVDGLSLQGLARHLSPAQMIDQLDAFLDELLAPQAHSST